MTERLYYRDCQLLDFTARVVSIADADGRPAVILDRTAFYPTSGGQPFDTGVLSGTPVVDVVDAPAGILHVLDGPVPPVGSTVAGRVDAERRRDHTQQHTGQHILSQAFERVRSLHTVSFHLGADSCTIDLDGATLDDATAREAESLANQVVLEDRPVLIHFVSADEVGQFQLRKATRRTGEVRIVEIEDFDHSACGGTHVQRTGQVGPIKIRRWERRGSQVRVEFLCGWRALRDYSARLDATRVLAERLRVRDSDILPAVTRALDELERIRDDVSRLREQLLDCEADDLVRAALRLRGVPTVNLVARVYENRSPDELKHLALAVVKKAPTVVLLGSSGDRCHLVFAQQTGLPFDMSALLRDAVARIGGRGGGSRDLAQGGGPAGAPIALAIDQARRLLTSES